MRNTTNIHTHTRLNASMCVYRIYSHLPSGLVVWPVGVVVTFAFCGKVRSVCGMVCRRVCYVCFHPHTYAWYEATIQRQWKRVRKKDVDRRWRRFQLDGWIIICCYSFSSCFSLFFLIFLRLHFTLPFEHYVRYKRLGYLYFVNFVGLLCMCACVLLLLAFFDFNFI